MRDPARILAGDFATDQVVRELRERWQLDRPLPIQYAAYLGGLLRGDLGRSTATSLPVAADLGERFLRTLELAAAAMVIGVLVGGLAGVLGATRRASAVDYLATVVALVGVSTPIFIKSIKFVPPPKNLLCGLPEMALTAWPVSAAREYVKGFMCGFSFLLL